MAIHNRGLAHGSDESAINMDTENRLRVSDNSQIAQFDAQTLATAAARECPSISTINIDKSVGVHIGPKIVSVVQNVDNNEKVKGRFLGLELVSLTKPRGRLRCSVAVFLCWAFIVAILLTIFIFYLILSATPERLDIDLSLPRYLASVIKKTSRAERIACVISVIVLVVCISLIVYFVKSSSTEIPESDIAPDPWNITREMWLAQPYDKSDIMKEGELVRLVIINHSASSECHTFRVCAAELRNIQGYYIAKLDRDIPYNFIVGNDGRIYEGRGWQVVGAHTRYYNNCTLGVGFIGDYRPTSNTHSEPSEAQVERLKMLLSDGVKRGFLHPDYVIVGAKDIQTDNKSPGENLYNVMKQWDHFDNVRYRNLTCNQIRLGIENNSTRTKL